MCACVRACVCVCVCVCVCGGGGMWVRDGLRACVRAYVRAVNHYLIVADVQACERHTFHKQT